MSLAGTQLFSIVSQLQRSISTPYLVIARSPDISGRRGNLMFSPVILYDGVIFSPVACDGGILIAAHGRGIVFKPHTLRVIPSRLAPRPALGVVYLRWHGDVILQNL